MLLRLRAEVRLYVFYSTGSQLPHFNYWYYYMTKLSYYGFTSPAKYQVMSITSALPSSMWWCGVFLLLFCIAMMTTSSWQREIIISLWSWFLLVLLHRPLDCVVRTSSSPLPPYCPGSNWSVNESRAPSCCTKHALNSSLGMCGLGIYLSVGMYL